MIKILKGKIFVFLLVGLFFGINCFPNIIGNLVINNKIITSKGEVDTVMCSKDSYINYGSDDNYGGISWLYASQDNITWWGRSYLFFDLSLIPPDKNIESATLKLYGGYNNSFYPGNIYFYAVNGNWNEYTINYYNAPGWHSSPVTSAIFSDESWISIDVTPFVNDWITGIKTNHGFIFMTSGSSEVYGEVNSREAGFNKGPRLEIEYENIPPTVNIISPNSGATVNGIITINGNASDPDGPSDLMEVKVDTGSGFQKASGTNIWSYVWDTTEVEDGMHTIYAVAIDKEYESSTIKSVEVNVSNQNRPPNIEIFSPEENDMVTALVSIHGSASDPDGNETLTRVEVKIDDKPWQNATGMEYWNYSWNTDDELEGFHTIRARSFDGVFYSNDFVVNVSVQHDISEVVIVGFNGGFGLQVDIKNIGTATANDVNWFIDVEENFAFILSGSHTEDMIDKIVVNETKKIQSNNLRGIGLITITVKVTDASKQASAFLLGPLVLRVNEI